MAKTPFPVGPTGGFGPPTSRTFTQKPLFMSPVGMMPEQEKLLSGRAAVTPGEVTTEEMKIPMTDTQLLGMGQATDRYVGIDWQKTSPGLSLTDVLPLDDEGYRATFMGLDEVENAQGEVFPLDGLDYAQRLSVADRFGAVAFAKYNEAGERVTDRIPWENIITSMTKFPEEINVGNISTDITNMTLEEYERIVLANRAFTTLATPDPNLGKVIHAQYLNEVLIRNGIDERGRALIIHDQLKTPEGDELVRLATGAMDVIGRGVIESALWGVGETADIIGGIMGVNMSDSIADYKTRQGVVDSWWKPLAYDVQEEFAQQNIVVDLATARDLAATQTGFLPFAAQLTIEFLAPSKAALKKRGVTAAKDLRLFNVYARDARRQNPNLTPDQLAEGFIQERASNGFLRVIPGLDSTFVKNRRAAAYADRLTTAFQFSDTTLPVAQRAEVAQTTQYLGGLLTRRDELNKVVDTDGISPRLTRQLDKVNEDIAEAQYRLLTVERRSSIPKYVRDMNMQDTYLIAGAATVGHFFNELEGYDRDIGTMAGLVAGITASVVRGNTSEALSFIRQRLPMSQQGRLEFIAKEMSRANPEIRQAIEYNAIKIAEYQDTLIAAGVDPDVLKVTLPIITDIVTLRHFESTISQVVSAKGIMSSEQTKNIQEMYSLNQRLNGELNKILAKFEATTEPEKQFFDMIDYFLKETGDARKRLDGTLTSFNKQGVGHYTGGLNGNRSIITSDTSPLGMDSAEEFQTFPQAMDSLNSQNLINHNALPDDGFRGIITESEEFVNTEITTAANAMTDRIGNRDAAKRDINAEGSLDIAVDTTPGGLFSMHLEATHSNAKAIASRPYKYLDDVDDPETATKYYALGSEVQGVPKVDTRDVFKQLFEVDVPGVGPLTQIRKQDVSPGDLATIDKTIVELTDSFFATIAQQRGQSKADLLKDLRAKAEDAGIAFPAGRKPQAIIADYLVSDAADNDIYLPLFEMSPGQLRELDMAVTGLTFKYKDRGGVIEKLTTVDDLLQTKFDMFELDGVPLEQLQVRNEAGDLVGLKDYLDNAGEGWKEFKANWYDPNEGAVVSELMSWGKRRRTEVTADNPGGVRYNKPVAEFLKMDMLIDENKSNRLMLSIGRTLGQPVGNKGYRLIEGATNTNTAQAYIRAFVGEEISKMVQNGTATADNIRDLAQKIENNITMIDANGAEKPLISVMRVVDDTLGDYRGSVPKELADAAEQAVTREIKIALKQASKPATDRLERMDEALTTFNAISGTNASRDNVGKLLIGSGRNGYNRFKKALSLLEDDSGNLRYTPDQVDQIISDLYLLDARTALFVPTGKKIVKKVTNENGERVISEVPELSDNPMALQMFLGQTPEQRALVKEIIGEDRFKVWEAMAGFLTELRNNPVGNTGIIMKGAPRALSVESYISRLYAINRGVVRPQYVGTEALLQSLRHKNFEFLTACLTDPELGELFLEMVRLGKPLDPKRDARFKELTIQAYAVQTQMHGAEKKDVVDVAGRKFTVYATPAQKARMGYTPEATNLFLPDVDASTP